MNWKRKFRNKGFWVSLAAAVVMVLQACGLKVDLPYVNEIVSAVLGVLVVLGIVSDADKGKGYLDPPAKEEENSEQKGD